MPAPGPGAGWHRLCALRSPPPFSPPRSSPRPLALAPRAPHSRCPRAARSRVLRGAAPRRLLSFQPRWRRAVRVRALSRSMSGSCRRSRAPTPPAWGPPSGKAFIPPRTSNCLRRPVVGSRAGRPDRWCARRRAGAVRGGGLGPRPGWGGAEPAAAPVCTARLCRGSCHLAAGGCGYRGASDPGSRCAALRLPPGLGPAGLPDRGGTEGALAAGVRGAKVNC